MNKIYSIRNKQSGYTMLEVLVAMTLGLVVLGSAIGMQISHQKGFKTTESKLSMQTNARFAYEFIAKDLRELGAVGCRTAENLMGGETLAKKYTGDYRKGAYNIALNNVSVAHADFRIGREIIGYENNEGSTTWTPVVSGDFSFTGDMKDGSDAITVRGAIGRTYRVDFSKAGGDLATDRASVQLNMLNISKVNLKPKNYAALSQCNAVEIFKVTGSEAEVSAGKIGHAAGVLGDDNASATFTQKGFAEGSVAELRRMAVTTYYVADNPSGIPTLYRDVDGIADQLVEGVERMQIEYGVNINDATHNVPDVFRTADWVEANDQWRNVVALRLSFIMRSKEEVYEQVVSSKSYKLPGASVYTYTPSDKYARLVYTSTISLRNRLTGNRI